MGQNQMIAYEEMLEMQKNGECFMPFPAWLEINPKYANRQRERYYEAVVVSGMDCGTVDEDTVVYIDGSRNYDLLAYGKTWRLWYAYRNQIPQFEAPWEQFA